MDARNGGISASRTLETLPTPTPTGNNSSGIVFDDKNGTVYGNVTLDESLTINQGETLTVPDGSKLDCNNNLTNKGTILVETGGTVSGNLSGGTGHDPQHHRPAHRPDGDRGPKRHLYCGGQRRE